MTLFFFSLWGKKTWGHGPPVTREPYQKNTYPQSNEAKVLEWLIIVPLGKKNQFHTCKTGWGSKVRLGEIETYQTVVSRLHTA